MLLPSYCSICEDPGPSPCAGCVAGLVRATPVPPPPPPGLVWCRSLLELEGGGRELVARLKYRNARSSLRWLAEGMAGLVGDPGRGSGPTIVTWAPTTAERRRQRGFDQAELLARGVSRRLRLPCRRLLKRRPGPHQTGRSLQERRHGVDFAPTIRALPGDVAVLVIDDVVTSGSTLSAAARSLRNAGAGRVYGLTAARTP